MGTRRLPVGVRRTTAGVVLALLLALASASKLVKDGVGAEPVPETLEQGGAPAGSGSEIERAATAEVAGTKAGLVPAADDGSLTKQNETNKEAAPPAKYDGPRPEPQMPAGRYFYNRDLPPADRPHYRCEICMMVVGRKLQAGSKAGSLTPGGLCGGLNHPDDVVSCHATLEALAVYDRYIVDWLYGDGCQRKHGDHEWLDVKPCPQHIICSWMLHDWAEEGPAEPGPAVFPRRRTFCQLEDLNYRRSPNFNTKHHVVSSADGDVTGSESEEAEPAGADETAGASQTAGPAAFGAPGPVSGSEQAVAGAEPADSSAAGGAEGADQSSDAEGSDQAEPSAGEAVASAFPTESPASGGDTPASSDDAAEPSAATK